MNTSNITSDVILWWSRLTLLLFPDLQYNKTIKIIFRFFFLSNLASKYYINSSFAVSSWTVGLMAFEPAFKTPPHCTSALRQ